MPASAPTPTVAPAGSVCVPTDRWNIRRMLFLMAGTFTLLGTALAAFVSPWFLILPALVGTNQLLMSSLGWCPMSLLLGRCGVPD